MKKLIVSIFGFFLFCAITNTTFGQSANSQIQPVKTVQTEAEENKNVSQPAKKACCAEVKSCGSMASKSSCCHKPAAKAPEAPLAPVTPAKPEEGI